MGLDLLYKSDTYELATRFALADWHTLEEVRKHLPDMIAVAFDTPDFGEPVTIPLAELQNAIRQLEEFLAQKPELLPYTYQMKYEYFDDGKYRHKFGRFTTGGTSGFHVPGDDKHCALWAGLNKLTLEKMSIGEDGKGYVVEVIDLRNEKELLTVEMGLVKFRKRKAKTSLRQGLSKIREFLEQLDSNHVIKIVG